MPIPARLTIEGRFFTENLSRMIQEGHKGEFVIIQGKNICTYEKNYSDALDYVRGEGLSEYFIGEII